VFIAGIVSFVWLGYREKLPYALSSNAHTSLPNFTFPSLTIETPTHTYSFWEVLSELSVGIIVIPIVGILTNISIGKLSKYKKPFSTENDYNKILET